MERRSARPLAVMRSTLLRPSIWHWRRSTRPSRSSRSTSRHTLYWASCVRSCTPVWRSMPFGLRSISWRTWYQSSGGRRARFKSSSTLSRSVRSVRTRLAQASTTAGVSLAHAHLRAGSPINHLRCRVRPLAAEIRLRLHGFRTYAIAFECRCMKQPFSNSSGKETSDEALLHAWRLLALSPHRPQRGRPGVRQGQGRRQDQGHGRAAATTGA